ncbi:MAG: response regulator transcription factor [Opitutales bacterium]|jgi:DNA-binding NarL/FixJ family response regulator|nr:response regulator transcription factor [Opitutales bacterium]MDP4658374.1 response regulator transcription factor [Opitutales bacterium]MDP4775363.1 response regulator transcription factor [Opitutales bacterium]MDP4787576.1 response regulator transcription factor [Opitutales bacterium]MDP4894131.1 response regulator transcription factor [Opitutales bacterium]
MKTSVRKAKSVVVVEDQTAICELIIEMLEARGAYRVLGSTADGHEGLALAKQLKPDILILDILLPGISGLEVLRQLHETQPDLKVLIFSAKSEKQIARGLLKAGVRGYVPKSARLSELRQAVDAVAAGDTWFSETFQKAMADALTAPESDVDAKGATLTEREKEIAVLLAKSYSSKEVAVKLDISAKTVENHRTNLMRKLGVHDVAGVIRFVVRQGLYDPTEG